MESDLKTLILSSADPTIGPGRIALDAYNAMKQEGYDVDLLTLYPCKDYPEFGYVLDQGCLRKKLQHYVDRLRWHLRIFRPDGYDFYYKEEANPPIPSKKVLAAINKKYDVIRVIFWQGMLSFKTLNDIYEQQHCKFVFAGVDYSHMSGGCHFTRNCERYKVGCGCCPAFHSSDENDFTHQNVLYRDDFYKRIKPIVFGNAYMSEFYKQSYLLKDYPVVISKAPIINTDVFKPKNKTETRIKYGIDTKKNVIFFGCQHLDNPRKGIKYLVEALNLLYNELTEEVKRNVLVVTAGSQHAELAALVSFESIGLGLLPINELPDIYSLADCYVCPSIDDAGPMMVNQSICCGTPVVGFDMGAVKQLIKENGLGYVAKLRDSADLAQGIKKIIFMPKDEYNDLSQKCREVAISVSSYKSKVEFLMNIIKTQ